MAIIRSACAVALVAFGSGFTSTRSPDGQIAERNRLRGAQILLPGSDALDRCRGRHVHLLNPVRVSLHRERVAADGGDRAPKWRYAGA